MMLQRYHLSIIGAHLVSLHAVLFNDIAHQNAYDHFQETLPQTILTLLPKSIVAQAGKIP